MFHDDQNAMKAPKTTKWKEKGCSTVALIARFNDEDTIVFLCYWYDIHRKHLSMYMDTL